MKYTKAMRSMSKTLRITQGAATQKAVETLRRIEASTAECVENPNAEFDACDMLEAIRNSCREALETWEASQK